MTHRSAPSWTLCCSGSMAPKLVHQCISGFFGASLSRVILADSDPPLVGTVVASGVGMAVLPVSLGCGVFLFVGVVGYRTVKPHVSASGPSLCADSCGEARMSTTR